MCGDETISASNSHCVIWGMIFYDIVSEFQWLMQGVARHGGRQQHYHPMYIRSCTAECSRRSWTVDSTKKYRCFGCYLTTPKGNAGLWLIPATAVRHIEYLPVFTEPRLIILPCIVSLEIIFKWAANTPTDTNRYAVTVLYSAVCLGSRRLLHE